MRLGFLLLSVEVIRASTVWAQDPPPLMEAMFCDYVADFAPQIARNRIRNVPQGTPVVLYQWVEDAYSLEQQWVPAGEQRDRELLFQ